MDTRLVVLLDPEKATAALAKLQADGILQVLAERPKVPLDGTEEEASFNGYTPQTLPKSALAALMALRGLWADSAIDLATIRQQAWPSRL